VADYRDQALRLYPHVCARCGRSFTHSNLRELTVHHRDHDHHNNPPDGSNWELLCLYCHDNEHRRQLEAATAAKVRGAGVATGQPLSDLRELLAARKSAGGETPEDG
jgi:5-methylcytosine-specific restriction endonuclease McrA